MVGALITSLAGAVLLLATDFAGSYWRNYYVEGWLNIGAFSIFGLIIIPLAIGLLVCTMLAVKCMGSDSPPPIRTLRWGFLLSLIVFILVIIGGIAFAIHSISEDYNSWWFDAGFYGGAIGSLLTSVLFFLALKQSKKQQQMVHPYAPPAQNVPPQPPYAQPPP